MVVRHTATTPTSFFKIKIQGSSKVINQLLVVDVATVFPDQVSQTLAQLRQYCAANGVDVGRLILVVRRDDRALVEAKFGAVQSMIEIEPFGDGRSDTTAIVIQAIQERLAQMATQGTPIAVEVVSYRGWVLKAIQSLHLPPLRIVSVNFQRIVGCNPQFAPRASVYSKPIGGWRFGHIATEQEALSVLLKGLLERGIISRETAVRQASIRDVLAVTDPRFRGNSTTTGTHGMIRHLVAVAQRQGLITVIQTTPRDAVNPVIWLNSEATVLEPAITVSPLKPDSESTAEANPTPRAVEIETGAGHSDEASNPSSVGETGEDKADSPSELIKKALMEIGFGPYPVARVALYDSIDGVLSEHRKAGPDKQPLSLRKVVKEALKLAPGAVKQRGFDPLRQRGVWKYAAALVKKVLLRAGALLSSDGTPVVADLGADLTPLGEAHKDWRCRADAEIVLAYIEHAGRLPQSSVEDLAGALYASRDDDPYHTTVSAIRHLLEQKKLVEVGVGDEISYQLPARAASVVPESRSTLASSDDGNGKLVAVKPR